MTQVLSLNPSICSPTRPGSSSRLQCLFSTRFVCQNPNWNLLLRNLKCNGRVSCLFSDKNRREEQARKALESALGGKKNEFEKWNREIERKEKSGGGSDTGGGGGWFRGGGGWFGWANGDHFWSEAQQTGLTVLGIILMHLIIAKGEVMSAVFVNLLLYALRGARDGFTSLTSKFVGNKLLEASADSDGKSKKEAYDHVSAKDSIVRKWGSD